MDEGTYLELHRDDSVTTANLSLAASLSTGTPQASVAAASMASAPGAAAPVSFLAILLQAQGTSHASTPVAPGQPLSTQPPTSQGLVVAPHPLHAALAARVTTAAPSTKGAALQPSTAATTPAGTTPQPTQLAPTEKPSAKRTPAAPVTASDASTKTAGQQPVAPTSVQNSAAPSPPPAPVQAADPQTAASGQNQPPAITSLAAASQQAQQLVPTPWPASTTPAPVVSASAAGQVTSAPPQTATPSPLDASKNLTVPTITTAATTPDAADIKVVKQPVRAPAEFNEAAQKTPTLKQPAAHVGGSTSKALAKEASDPQPAPETPAPQATDALAGSVATPVVTGKAVVEAAAPALLGTLSTAVTEPHVPATAAATSTAVAASDGYSAVDQAVRAVLPVTPPARVELHTEAGGSSAHGSVSTAAPAVDVTSATAVAPTVAASPTSSSHGAANVTPVADAVAAHVDEARQTGPVTLHLELTPPELGTVRVRLVAQDQQINVSLVVQSHAAQHTLAAQVQPLRERLDALGVALGRFDVQQDGGGAAQSQQQPAAEQAPQRPALATAPVRNSPRTASASATARAGRIDVMA